MATSGTWFKGKTTLPEPGGRYAAQSPWQSDPMRAMTFLLVLSPASLGACAGSTRIGPRRAWMYHVGAVPLVRIHMSPDATEVCQFGDLL